MRKIFVGIFLVLLGFLVGYTWTIHLKIIHARDIAIGSNQCASIDSSSPFLLILSKNAYIPDEIMSCMHEAHIKGAWLEGIGALKNIQLAYYNSVEKKYISSVFNREESYELLNFSGNVGLKENQLTSHIHLTIADSKFMPIGGHFINGEVAITLELLVIPLKEPPIRTLLYPDEKNLWLITNQQDKSKE